MSLYTQYRAWENARWRYVGSVFDSFRAEIGKLEGRPARVVVTLGTMPGWGFRRLIEHCYRMLPADINVVWQTGSTDVTGLHIDAREAMPAAELEAAIHDADVVISHAGAGSALTALRCGKCPILVPRSAARGEHVDDHQLEVAQELAERNLALLRQPEELSVDDLFEAVCKRIVSVDIGAPIVLDSQGPGRWRLRGRGRAA